MFSMSTSGSPGFATPVGVMEYVPEPTGNASKVVLPEAAASLREAIRLQPDFAGAHTTLSTILRQLGDEEGAARERQLGAQISKDKTSLQAATFDTNSGKRLLGLGDLDGAISQFRAAIAQVPTYAPAHFHLAEALQKKGQTKEAREEYQRAAELDPQLKPQLP